MANPDLAGYERAVTLLQAGDAAGAQACLRAAIAQGAAAYPQAYGNLAALLRSSGRAAAAARACERALDLRPAPPAAVAAVLHFNAANAYRDQLQLTAALHHYDAAVTLEPGHGGFQLNRALALLLAGDEGRGWPAYEWRWRVRPELLPPLPPALPRWQGGTLPCGRLLVVAEQGIGDLVQFMRYGPLLRPWAPAGVDLLVSAELQPLLEAAGEPLFDRLCRDADGSHGAWVPLLSVPGLLGVRQSQGQVLRQAPYLQAEAARVEHWRRRLPRCPLIALTWQGNPDHERFESEGRSLPLEALAPLAAVCRRRGWRLVALQKGAGSEQLAGCSFADVFVEAQAAVSASLDFGDSLAILTLCERVVSSDTALVHLAGALGRPTELLLKHLPEWRWGLAASTTPWYPSVRLWRQQRPGDWAGVAQRLAAALSLRRLARNDRRAPRGE